MARRGENIYKRKDGRWEGRYIKGHIGTKIIYGYIYASTYQLVKEKLHIAKKNLDDGFVIKNDSILFGELSEKWLENRKFNVKESTYMRYYAIIDLHIHPFFFHSKVSDIDTDALQTYLLYLINEKGLANKTVSDVLVVMKSILRYGEQLHIYHNCSLTAVSVKVKKKEMRVLSCEEYQTLTEYLLSENSSSAVGMLIALYTGIRIGELCALKSDNVDFINRKIHISETMQRLKRSDGNGTYIYIGTPKSHLSVRDIPLTDFLYNIIANQNYQNGDYILTADSCYVEPRTMQYRFSRIMDKLGIKGATFHTMRHSFATRCVEVGFDIKSLSEILGHSNVNITLNRYVHSSFELKVINMKKLNAVLTYSPSKKSSDKLKCEDNNSNCMTDIIK